MGRSTRFGLFIDLPKLEANARALVGLCETSGIGIIGVTKGVHSDPRILEALGRGGFVGMADSRIENLAKLRRQGVSTPLTLVRIPRVSHARSVVRHATVSVNSDLTVLRALSRAAVALGLTHRVVLMIDVGDLREGVLPEHAVATVEALLRLGGLELEGIGTNIGCFGGVLPTAHNLGELVTLARRIENVTQRPIRVVSGGGTSSLQLVEDGTMPVGINQLRVGEAALLGRDTSGRSRLEDLHRDAFLLRAEVIEVNAKPSVPRGLLGLDAFGAVPEFVDRGTRRRAILALGKADVPPTGLEPVEPGLAILGASSDHMIVDVHDLPRPPRTGEAVEFRLLYPGLLALAHSAYISKHYRRLP